jgi:4-amino-4-deoxy-L-arabinose transferase-like glycosyltransferase
MATFSGKTVRFLDFITENKSMACTLALLLFAFVPMLILRDFTPSNELRYLSIANEALQNGHWFTFTLHGEPYTDKPPLYLWIVMLGLKWFGMHCMWFVGLFSMVPALVIVGVMQRWCRGTMDSDAQATAPWMLMTTAYFTGAAVVLRMDMLMTMFIVLSLHTFYRQYSGQGNKLKLQWLFALYVFLGIFTKAFMGFLIPFISILVFLIWKRQLGTFFRYWNWRTWLVILGGLACWFACVYIEGGPDSVYNLTVGQTVNRTVHASLHKKPFFMYVYYLTYSIAPWTLYCVGLLVAALRRHLIFNDLQRLFWVIIASTIVMLSCFGSKLEVYLLPTFPFICYLTLQQASHFQWNRWLAFAATLPAWLLSLALPVYLGLLFVPSFHYRSAWLFTACLLMSVSAWTALHAAYRHHDTQKSIRRMAAGICMAVFVGSLDLPQLNGDIGYTLLAEKAKLAAARCGAPAITTYRLRRYENMDIYFGHGLTRLSDKALLTDSCSKNLLITIPKSFSDTLFRQAVAGRHTEKCGKYLLIFPTKR